MNIVSHNCDLCGKKFEQDEDKTLFNVILDHEKLHIKNICIRTEEYMGIFTPLYFCPECTKDMKNFICNKEKNRNES